MSEYIDKNELFTTIGEKNGRMPLWLDEILMECKAADVAPVVLGEWKTIDGTSRCSECGYIPAYDNSIDDLFYSPFCPNCGAKMDGGGKNVR